LTPTTPFTVNVAQSNVKRPTDLKLIRTHVHNGGDAATGIEVGRVCDEPGVAVEIERRQLGRVTITI